MTKKPENKPMQSVYVRTWAQGTRQYLCGGVKEARSSRFGALADAEAFMVGTVETNGGPDQCGAEVVWSSLPPELVHHCLGHPAQAIGGRCFGCGAIVTKEAANEGWVYGVFYGTRWAITRDLKEATARAAMPDWEVRRMSAGGYDDAGSWDSPTFRVMSESFKG